MKKQTVLRVVAGLYALAGLATAGTAIKEKAYKDSPPANYLAVAAPVMLLGMAYAFERSRKTEDKIEKSGSRERDRFLAEKILGKGALLSSDEYDRVVYEDADTVKGREAFWAYNDIKETPIKDGRPYVH